MEYATSASFFKKLFSGTENTSTESRMGSIVIRDRETGQEIHRRETDKQRAHHEMDIGH